MNFYSPVQRALYIAECAVHSLRSIITLRGGQVRDARAWSRYYDESLIRLVNVSGYPLLTRYSAQHEIYPFSWCGPL